MVQTHIHTCHTWRKRTNTHTHTQKHTSHREIPTGVQFVMRRSPMSLSMVLGGGIMGHENMAMG